MNDLFLNYLREREGLDVYVHEGKGFMAYRLNEGGEFYIVHMYVLPDFRRQRVAWDMADVVFSRARDFGCTYVAGTIFRGARGSDESHKAMLAYGFKLHGWDAEKIVLTKEL